VTISSRVLSPEKVRHRQEKDDGKRLELALEFAAKKPEPCGSENEPAENAWIPMCR